MKTIKKVNVMPKFVELIPDRELMEENVIYISKQYNTSAHLCLCGCKLQVATPLNNKDSKLKIEFWDLYENGDKISLTPSISNEQWPCKSHYIITNNIANFV